MEITIADSEEEVGRLAAAAGAQRLREAIASQGHAVIVLATGRSQIGMLGHLTVEPDIDWALVKAFPLDDYVGLPPSHLASTQRYLKERFIDALPAPLGAFHPIHGSAEDPLSEAGRMSTLIRRAPVDVAFLGIGENAHIAFNDPPADFDTEFPYLVVELDERCRQQQVDEGWFDRLEEVPTEGISMSVHQILESRHMIITVPALRKAQAVKTALEGPVSAQVPASVLQNHSSARLFLDEDSASGISAARPTQK